jgi:hypothetical protein
VFDSRVYSPLSDVPPVLAADSGASNMQHMGVVKDFKITLPANNVIVPAPVLVMASANIIRWIGVSNLTYSVQTKSDLNFSNWLTLATVSSPTANFAFTNTLPATNQSFYRVSYP